MVNKCILAVVTIAGMVVQCFPMPNEREFAETKTVVEDVMGPELAAMKKGKKTPSEVADFALSMVDDSETAAEKYLLASCAYGLCVRDGDFEKAVKAMDAMRESVPDMPYDQFLKAIMSVSRGVTEKKAPELYARIAELKERVRSQSEIVKLTAELAKPKVFDACEIHCKLGRNYAVLDDWENALRHFAKSGGQMAKMAKVEIDDSPVDAKVAGFWWEQSEERTLPRVVATSYRSHSADLYKKGLDAGTISGLNKHVAEQRMEMAGKAAIFEPTCVNGSRKSARRVAHGLKQGDKIPILPDLKGNFAIEVQIKPTGMINRFPPQRNSGIDVWHQASGPMLLGLGAGNGETVALGVLAGKNGLVVFEYARCFMPATIVYQHEFNDKWIQLRVEIIKGHNPRLYVDGKMVLEGENSGKTIILTPDMVVGGACCKGMYPFNGEIRDFSVYAL